MQPHPHHEAHLHAALHHERTLAHGARHTERGQRGAARVVLVGQRRAEKRHEAVAEELVHGALVPVDLGQGELEEGVEQTVHRVGPQALGDRALCLEGRCLSYGAAIPYLPIVDLVRGFCGIADVDSPERIVDKVGATLESLGIERGRAAYLLQLLGVKADERASGESPDVLAARTHDTLRNA